MGAHTEDGTSLHSFLVYLVERRLTGASHLTLLEVSKTGRVDLLPSIFIVRSDNYDSLPELWAVVVKIPADGLPTLQVLSP